MREGAAEVHGIDCIRDRDNIVSPYGWVKEQTEGDRVGSFGKVIEE